MINNNKTIINKQDKIVIYKPSKNEVGLKVRFEDENIWLTQAQISELFGSERSVITKHLKNIFELKELNRNSVCAIFAHTATDGKVYRTQFYNFDVIISVGYRVNSQRATQFRQWATKILKKYLLQGYVINEERLLEAQQNFKRLQETILFLRNKTANKQLKGQEKEIINLLANYSKTLSLLDGYDRQKIQKGKGQKGKFKLEYDDCLSIILEIKNKLIAKKEAGELFGQARGENFIGIIHGLYQTFANQELYPTIEDKASNLLYLIIKDHSFSDGNKRISSFLFVYFLDKNNYLFRKTGERKINDNGLAALALLIAESNPKEKEQIIALIMQLLK
jgi:hypothetical protein